jgi:hypothetical protein
LVKGGQRNTQEYFTQIGATVAKIRTETVTFDLTFNWSANRVNFAWPQTSVTISAATEAQL